MKNKKFASFLAAAAALVLLAMPAFAADEQTELPAAEAAEVQQEQTAAPAEQETALPADAQTAGEPEQQLTYVALGDSITSGVGLADMKYNIAQIGYDLQPNFEGYPSQCYTALVGKGLGLDRQHAINLGLPGLMSPDMLDMVQNSAMPKMNQASGAYYVYPEYQEYLRKADIISIQIGSNDALVPCIVGLGEATNWKSEQLAALMVSGALRDFNFQKLGLFLEALNRMTLTFDESRATNRLLFRGMDEICDQAYTNVTASLPQIVASIRALNPDAKIVLLGYTNPEKKIVGITGRSGSGKSTFLRLLMRFWDVSSGSIRFGAEDIRRVNTAALREQESLVTQETELFDDTIENNIRIAKRDATREEVEAACKKAALDGFIHSLPKGYDTPVGELGGALSGGERQRIGVARAFLHDAPFLLLDEPTSNLDSLNEGVILKAVRAECKDKTVLLVSHRKSTMAAADISFSVESGRLS